MIIDYNSYCMRKESSCMIVGIIVHDSPLAPFHLPPDNIDKSRGAHFPNPT